MRSQLLANRWSTKIQGWRNQVEEIRNSKDPEFGKKTIFHGLLNGNLPDSEKTSDRLQQEANLLVVAGQDTTGECPLFFAFTFSALLRRLAITTAAIMYHLLANPEKLKKLKEELAVAIPDPQTTPDYGVMERLPYLSAVIQEGLRVNSGAATRMQRISPDEPLSYHDKDRDVTWTIPAGVPISMTQHLIHYNPNIFPKPWEFRPERWLENPRLDRYLLSFSKGTRICAGYTSFQLFPGFYD